MAEGGKSKKQGRGKRSPARAAYKSQERWKRNKVAKLEAYCKKNPNDLQAAESLKLIKRNSHDIKKGKGFGIKGHYRGHVYVRMENPGKKYLKPFHPKENPTPKGIHHSCTVIRNGETFFKYRKAA